MMMYLEVNNAIASVECQCLDTMACMLDSLARPTECADSQFYYNVVVIQIQAHLIKMINFVMLVSDGCAAFKLTDRHWHRISKGILPGHTSTLTAVQCSLIHHDAPGLLLVRNTMHHTVLRTVKCVQIQALAHVWRYKSAVAYQPECMTII